MSSPRTAIHAGLGLLGLAAVATASTPAEAGNFVYSNQFAARYNPLGLQDEFRFGYRTKLGDAPEDDILFGKSYLTAGLIGRASPQFLQGGLFLKTLPIAVLELSASASRVKGISSVQDVQDSSLFTQATKDAALVAGDIIVDGWRANIQPRLQYKNGAIAVRYTAAFTMFALEGSVEDGYFYDQTLDVVTGFDSWVWQNDADLLYADDDKKWVVGARYTHVKPLDQAATAPYDYQIQRAGPLFAYKFPENNPGKGFGNQALIVLSQWHIQHPVRTGQTATSQAIPYFALAYSFRGQIGGD